MRLSWLTRCNQKSKNRSYTSRQTTRIPRTRVKKTHTRRHRRPRSLSTESSAPILTFKRSSSPEGIQDGSQLVGTSRPSASTGSTRGNPIDLDSEEDETQRPESPVPNYTSNAAYFESELEDHEDPAVPDAPAPDMNYDESASEGESEVSMVDMDDYDAT